MKKNLHPTTQKVVFQDVVTGTQFLIDSTTVTAETVLWSDGNHYPLVKVEISSSSHPAFNGGNETEKKPSSRREKFDQKYVKREWLQ